MRTKLSIAGAGVLVMLVTGCSGSSGSATPATSTTSSAETDQGGAADLPPLTPCPSPTASGTTFPDGPSSDLPRPAFATDAETVPTEATDVDLLRFSTAMSLRDAVLFVTREFPAAGYVLGDGDSEGHEADIPFSKGALHGKLRLSSDQACSTTWLEATTSATGTTLDDVPGEDGH